jgi:hypothetical protein
VEGGHTVQGGQGGHTGSGARGLVSMGASSVRRCSVIRGRGRRLSAGARYSWAGSSLSEGDHCCSRWGVIVVRGHGDACPM